MTQATLRESVQFEGIGLHTGAPASVDVRPAAPGTGLTFVLGATRFPATPKPLQFSQLSGHKYASASRRG